MTTPFIDNMVKQIDSIDICDDLKKFAAQAMDAVNDLIKSIGDQLDFLGPLADLLSSPAANPAEIVKWITNFIDKVLKPLYEPFLKLQAQLIELTQDALAIPAAVERAMERIGNCVVSLPSIPGTSTDPAP